MNAAFEALQTAFENTLSRDGTSPNQMAAPLDMNSNRITNLATPVSSTDAVTKAYLDEQIAALTALVAALTPDP